MNKLSVDIASNSGTSYTVGVSLSIVNGHAERYACQVALGMSKIVGKMIGLSY